MATAHVGSSPLVSIVTPTYNQAAFLRETIESVLVQDYPRVQYVVIDDGSTDETPGILKPYGEKVRWWSRPNRGQTATINEGWEHCEGDILTWLNSDDTLLPGALTRIVEYLARHQDADVVFGDTLFTDGDGRPIERSGAREFEYEEFVVECDNPIPQCSAFFRRAVIEHVGTLDSRFYFFMDWDLWLRAGIGHRIVYYPELLSTYRLHPESKSVSQSRRSAPELEYMYEKYFSRGDIPRVIRRSERRAMANMYFTSAGYYLRGGDAREGARMAWKALSRYPGLLLRPGMLHKFLYCTVGRSIAYRSLRGAWHRIQKAGAPP